MVRLTTLENYEIGDDVEININPEVKLTLTIEAIIIKETNAVGTVLEYRSKVYLCSEGYELSRDIGDCE